MDADYDMGTPSLKNIAHVTNASRMKELASFRTNMIDRPIEILHPVLPIAQYPVVKSNEPRSEVMRLFYGPYDTNGVRLTLQEFLNARHDCRGRRAMAAAGIGRKNQNLRSVGISHLSFGLVELTL